jgi:hypothetical protein
MSALSIPPVPATAKKESSVQSQVNELTTNRKALTINLDAKFYGTLAEIGAGQEVARYFFQAGGASGTIATSISAYDMKFSDAIYGKSARYVSKERVLSMLEHEYNLVEERLAETRGKDICFFAFANTVAAQSFKGTPECHGWMGIRFQKTPRGQPNDIIMHVRMLDKTNIAQQNALGIIGVNLLYAAFYYTNDLTQFLESLEENVGTARIEVDMLSFIGPDLSQHDNRMISLKLVERGLTNAALFGPNNTVLHPSDILYKRTLLVERGTFCPITKLNVNMLDCAGAQLVQHPKIKDKNLFTLLEITLKNLPNTPSAFQDLLVRADTLNALGYNVLISNYYEYYRLLSYFRRYTKEMIGMVLGINLLLEIFNDVYYQNLEGGLLEACGRLFKEDVKLYIYPMKGNSYLRYLNLDKEPSSHPVAESEQFSPDSLITADNLKVKVRIQGLYNYLLENNFIEPLKEFDPNCLGIFSRDVLKSIQENKPDWEQSVPEKLVELIKKNKLWGSS